MAALRAILIYLAVVLIGGAFLAPWVYWGARELANLTPGLAWVTHVPFHRYLNRCLLVLALTGLWPLARTLGVASLRELVGETSARQRALLVTGLLLGILSLCMVAAIELFAGVRAWRSDRSLADVIPKAASALVSALGVGVLEELLFRGLLFRAMRRQLKTASALALSSLIYAGSHLLHGRPAADDVTAWSGIVTLGEMFGQLADIQALVPEFITLFIVGAILCVAVWRTGSLLFSVGLHSGWVLFIKLYSYLTTFRSGFVKPWWTAEKLLDGWLSCIVLSGGLVISLAFVTRRWSRE